MMLDTISNVLMLILLFIYVIHSASADPNDWVNVNYIVQRNAATDKAATVNAQTSIANGASSTAKQGPWTVTNSKGILPPSKNPQDYLSFAPYHWPNCNWCGRGATHLVNPGNGGNRDTDGDDGSNGNSDSGPPDPNNVPDDSDPYPDGGDMDESSSNEENAEAIEETLDAMSGDDAAAPGPINSATERLPENYAVAGGPSIIVTESRMRRVRRMAFDFELGTNVDLHSNHSREERTGSSAVYSTATPTDSLVDTAETDSESSTLANLSSTTTMNSQSAASLMDNQWVTATSQPSESAADVPQASINGPLLLPSDIFTGLVPTPTDSTQTTDHIIVGTPIPAQAPVKTGPPKASCTPSPTSSLAPTATWTTCPYIGRDGQVNPDVRLLNGPEAINSVSQSVLYNAIAYALQKTSSYSTTATSFIDTFFLNPSTRMNPNMNFGQMVRGPGQAGQQGTFTGVLDLRGIVKIINGIMILKAASSPDWTAARDQQLVTWMGQYATWLQNSPLGKMSASRPNNHATFYVSQLIATRVLAGDVQGATAAVQNYFSHQFLDQIAASGEQPFEAVRTRPFHYRCFNLEAMITNAKIGDQLGLNLWSIKSKYGANIQTALDYTMGLDPKTEDVKEILPHIASIAAAYGDPNGKYAAFLKKAMSDYQSKSFWLYDQTAALPSSPASQSMHKRAGIWSKDSPGNEMTSNSTLVPVIAQDRPLIPPFECPAVFDDEAEVEIDNGIFVTCDELKPFYEIVRSVSK